MPKRIPPEEKRLLDAGISEYTNRGFNVTNARNLIWLVTNHIATPVLCSVCASPTSWLIAKKQYAVYCSNTCVHASEQVKEKTRNAITPKMGDIISKRKRTNTERYGDSNFLSSTIGKKVVKSTLHDKYNVTNVSQLDWVKEKKKVLSMQHWGVSHPSQHPQTKSKAKATNNLLYSRDSWAQQHLSETTLIQLNSYDWLYEHHITMKNTLVDMSVLCENIDPTAIGRYLRKLNIPITHYTHFQSSHERELAEWFSSIGVTFQQNDRTVIQPLELDFILPEYKLAVEMCGVYWHGDWRLDKNYHKSKLDACDKADYKLLTIFEDEWVTNKEVVKRMILNKLNKSSDLKVNARSTVVIPVDKSTRNIFMTQNHIQGDGPGSITYGLMHNAALVAVMTFIKTDDTLTLNRYATSCLVRGGFTKLLSHAQKRNPGYTIVTFADMRWGSGELYKSVGFVCVKVLGPQYCYVVNKKRVHRSQFRRQYLADRLPVFDPELTEFQNCDNNNIVRLWDCGMIKYILPPQLS